MSVLDFRIICLHLTAFVFSLVSVSEKEDSKFYVKASTATVLNNCVICCVPLSCLVLIHSGLGHDLVLVYMVSTTTLLTTLNLCWLCWHVEHVCEPSMFYNMVLLHVQNQLYWPNSWTHTTVFCFSQLPHRRTAVVHYNLILSLRWLSLHHVMKLFISTLQKESRSLSLAGEVVSPLELKWTPQPSVSVSSAHESPVKIFICPSHGEPS